MSLANRFRPKRFADIVGQESEVEVMKTILVKGWKPSALLFAGPFGCGKTSLARLMARALLCERRGGFEPCNNCPSCTSMDNDNHPCYTEKDAASEGLVGDVREMKDEISYRTVGKMRVLVYDESHNLSAQAQNALLQVLEEGVANVLFMFATTETGKMLPTIRSRCVELGMKLLTAAQIFERVKAVCLVEGFQFEEKALRIVATYVRGHMRDALILLEQLSKMADVITEVVVRTYLRMDKMVDIYSLLTITDRKEGFTRLEELLCNYSPSELAELIGEVLVGAFKVSLGVTDTVTQVDGAWLGKVAQVHGEKLLEKAERILAVPTDFSTITLGLASFMRVLFETGSRAEGLAEVMGPVVRVNSPASLLMRKPAKVTQ